MPGDHPSRLLYRQHESLQRRAPLAHAPIAGRGPLHRRAGNVPYLQAKKVIARLIRWYNEERLQSALGFLRPIDYYRGKPEAMYAVRRQKLAEARHRRRERNLQLRQPTLPLTHEETVP